MNLFLRFLWLSLTVKFRPPCSVFGPCRTQFRCSIFDLDVLRHMNNGKYLSLLDLGRIDLMNRAGLSSKLQKAGYYPVVAAETIRFRRPLKWFVVFEIETQVIGWDEKAFVLSQKFYSHGQLMADAVVRARFLKISGGSVRPTEILSLAGLDEIQLDPIEDWIKSWNQVQAEAL